MCCVAFLALLAQIYTRCDNKAMTRLKVTQRKLWPYNQRPPNIDRLVSVRLNLWPFCPSPKNVTLSPYSDSNHVVRVRCMLESLIMQMIYTIRLLGPSVRQTKQLAFNLYAKI